MTVLMKLIVKFEVYICVYVCVFKNTNIVLYHLCILRNIYIRSFRKYSCIYYIFVSHIIILHYQSFTRHQHISPSQILRIKYYTQKEYHEIFILVDILLIHFLYFPLHFLSLEYLEIQINMYYLKIV